MEKRPRCSDAVYYAFNDARDVFPTPLTPPPASSSRPSSAGFVVAPVVGARG